eukprot:47525-Eustigmatos_ZCMA.PRE.4
MHACHPGRYEGRTPTAHGDVYVKCSHTQQIGGGKEVSKQKCKFRAGEFIAKEASVGGAF